jgi:hypothetical protein
MSTWGMRFGALGLAIVVSLIIFLFWGRFGAALVRAMEIEYAPDKKVTAPQTPGEVSVSLPSVQPQKNCPKGQTCK